MVDSRVYKSNHSGREFNLYRALKSSVWWFRTSRISWWESNFYLHVPTQVYQMGKGPGPGGGTAIYGLYRYVPL